jgi:hypothetical protein
MYSDLIKPGDLVLTKGPCFSSRGLLQADKYYRVSAVVGKSYDGVWVFLITGIPRTWFLLQQDFDHIPRRSVPVASIPVREAI